MLIFSQTCTKIVEDNLSFTKKILLWEPLKTPVEHLERQIYL